jgi:hypothetical protein
MRRVLTAVTALSLFAVGFPAAAQSLPSKKKAADLLRNAEQQELIVAPGRAPFHLLAKLHYTLSATSSDGTYEVFWAGPERFREEFRLGNLGESDIASDGKLYVRRSTPVLTFPQWWVRSLTGLPKGDSASKLPSVSRIYGKNNAGEALTCFAFAAPSKGRTVCLDATTGQLASDEQNNKYAGISINFIEDRFIRAGAANYPRHIVFTFGNERLEITVENIEAVNRFEDSVFAAPAGASSLDWCAKPDTLDEKIRNAVSEVVFGSLASPESPQLQVYFVKVARDGRVELAALLKPDGTATNLDERRFGAANFSIRTCAGKPIEYEIAFMSSGIR